MGVPGARRHLGRLAAAPAPARGFTLPCRPWHSCGVRPNASSAPPRCACAPPRVFRASQRAQVAGNAQRLAVIRVDVEPRRAAIPLADFGPFGRILLGIYTLGVLVAESHPETLEEVYEKDGAEELSNHFPPLMPWWGRTPVLRPASTPVQAGPGGPAQTWRSAHSSIHLAEHDIQRTNNRHYVGHQAAPHHPVERLQIHERGRPHPTPRGLRGID